MILIDNNIVGYNQLHCAKSFLRSQQYAQLIKKFNAFYAEGLLTRSQQPAMGVILIQMNPNHIYEFHFHNINFHIIHPSCIFPSGFPTKILYTLLTAVMRATCPAHLTLVTLIIFGEEHSTKN